MNKKTSSKYFPESKLAHELLDGLKGIEIGSSAHNGFGLDTINVDRISHLDPQFKSYADEQMKLCGYVAEVDVVSNGDNLPFPDKSYDFVISSRVIEHFRDPVSALKEWARVAIKYIYIICPLRDALPSDVNKPLTPLQEHVDRHEGKIIMPDIDDHHSRWTPDSFKRMCEYYGFEVSHVQEIDDKVGNGFCIVIKLS